MTSLPTLRRKILRSFWILMILYGVLGLVLVISVQIASGTSPRMIHVNYDSISWAHQMEEAIAAIRDPKAYPALDLAHARALFDTSLTAEEGNTTEPGEKEIALGIRSLWGKIKASPQTAGNEDVVQLVAALQRLIALNEKGMFRLAQQNEELSKSVLYGAIAFFFISLIASIFLADGLAARISRPLKSIAEALHRRPAIGRKLKLVEPNTLELLILTQELTRLWERVTETDKVNVREIVEQKSKLESVLESVDDALLVLDMNSLVSHANACLLDLLALPGDRVLGQKWTDLASLGENYLKLRSLLSSELSDSTEVELTLGDTKRQYAARSRKILAPSNGPVATLYLLHDITEKRQRERFRSEFIDMLSHEIKTPLQSLGTATELLTARRLSLPEPVQPLVETISEDVERIRAVANEFVQVTQSHSKVMRLKMEVTAVNQALQEWLKPFYIVARDRGVTLDMQVQGSEMIWANLDRIKFPWVISNLLSNAIRFSPKASEVQVILTDRNGAVEIQVTDEGPGISSEDQAKMFEPFFQSPMTTSSGSKGLFGIGLTIAKEVVEAHDGRIEYYPRQPHGSEFRIVLPFPNS